VGEEAKPWVGLIEQSCWCRGENISWKGGMMCNDIGASCNHALSKGKGVSGQVAEVLEHGPGFPSSHHANGGVIHLRLKQGHGAAGTKGSCTYF